jgi:hypothetical protein
VIIVITTVKEDYMYKTNQQHHNHLQWLHQHHRQMTVIHALRGRHRKVEEQKEGELCEDKTCCNEEVKKIGVDIMIGVAIIIIGFLVVAAIMHIRNNYR